MRHLTLVFRKLRLEFVTNIKRSILIITYFGHISLQLIYHHMLNQIHE